tara:strand:- start:99 stop:674 length:576 start_codon:yes stop_codon:yes gene_type:complete
MLKNKYWLFNSALSSNICNDIIKLGEQNLSKGETLSNNTNERDSHVSWINEKWLFDLLQEYVKVANKHAGWNFEWDYTEPLQYTTYKSNQHYDWHCDGGIDTLSAYNGDLKPLVGKVRKLSVSVSLSSDYEGGDFMFDYGPYSDERYFTCKDLKSLGTILVFPSFLYHKVNKVTKGVRKSLVMWNCGGPFK